jgi:thioredoxin 1
MQKFLLFFSLISLSSFSQGKHIIQFPVEFEKTIKATNPLHLIDLRTKGEFETGHIKKAINVDYLRADFEDYIKSIYSKKTPLVLYCQSGKTSEDAAVYLSELGYENITILKGGFEKWISSSKPYTSSKKTFEPLGFISTENYNTLVKDNKWVLVDFYADWCGPCKKMAPILYKIDQENSQLNLLKIDADKNTGMTEQLEISEIPTMILYKNGKQVWRHTGLVSEDEIRSKIF